MIEKKGNEWELCQYKVTHKSHGNEQVHYTNDRDYWRDTVDKHDHLTDLRFEEMSYSAEQKRRLEELNQKNVPESYMEVARDMVREGIQEDDPVTEYRVRAGMRAIERGEKKLEDIEEEYRDKVRQRRRKGKGKK